VTDTGAFHFDPERHRFSALDQGLDESGRVLFTRSSPGVGNQRDFDFKVTAVRDVKTVRFTSLADQGNENVYGDIAIAEFQVE